MYTMRPAEFDYHAPTSLEEALTLLAEDEGSRPLAGGQSLIPLLKLRLALPSALVDLRRIPGLDEISANGGLTLGARATHRSVAESDAVRSGWPALAELAAQLGDPQVRNCGTIGGSISHADPAADYPTMLKALGATVTAKGPDGERTLAADDFFQGVFATALETGELVTSVTVPALAAGTGAAYVKHRHPASFYAVAAVAAVVSVEDGACTDARVTVGGVTAPPAHAEAAAEALRGSSGSEEEIAAAVAQVPEALTGARGDTYASGEYRTHLAKVLAGRAIAAAFERAAA
ncbi:MAG TPA: xanthine dehydrogenase family protein subunit M [Gaiellaceae bacterium]|jgi:carbon-monoxide dehydrogenase medium subunit